MDIGFSMSEAPLVLLSEPSKKSRRDEDMLTAFAQNPVGALAGSPWTDCLSLGIFHALSLVSPTESGSQARNLQLAAVASSYFICVSIVCSLWVNNKEKEEQLCREHDVGISNTDCGLSAFSIEYFYFFPSVQTALFSTSWRVVKTMTKLEKGKGLRRPSYNVKERESYELMRMIYLILCISCAVSFLLFLSWLTSAVKIWKISATTIVKGLSWDDISKSSPHHLFHVGNWNKEFISFSHGFGPNSHPSSHLLSSQSFQHQPALELVSG